MHKDVITVDVKTPIMAALETMKHNKVKRLPVTKNGKFTGLVTRALIRDASPSGATSLSIWEINYLISKMVVGDIMIKKPFTISPDMPVEEAMKIAVEKRVGAFPVIENGELIGIITQSDISTIVLDSLGLDQRDMNRISIKTSTRRFGFLRDLVEIFDFHRIPIMNMLNVPAKDGNYWFLVLQVRSKDTNLAIEDLRKKGFDVTDVT
ncbi:MAG: CBS domain-containing protein [Deltaproteobacteria bacterium]|nr:CBS domain-containing protein [Deltaproteobacteria bacterium]